MSTETSAIVVLVAAANAEQARTIARTTVERKLAACAQVLPIQSYYEWEGAIVEDDELLILLKSRREVYAELEACVKELHSYSVPEIIALPIVAGSASYLHWLDSIIAARPAGNSQ